MAEEIPDRVPPSREALDPDPLQSSLQELQGVGPATAQRFQRLGIETLGDLLHHFPTRHEDLIIHGKIRDVPDGERRSLFGTIDEQPQWVHSGRGRWEARLRPDDEPDQEVTLHWYTRYRPQICDGWQGWVTGVIRRFQAPVMAHPTISLCDQREPIPAGHGQIVAVYPSTDGLSQALIRSSMQRIFEREDLALDVQVPSIIGSERSLLSIYRGFHCPASSAECEICRSWLARIEMYFHAIQQARTRAQRKARKIDSLSVSPELEQRILARLPYSLTLAQQRVVQEIRDDLAAGFPMARLVQGDVGSGKTAVAIWAMLALAAVGRQSALIVPTTALADQHRMTLQNYLQGSRLEVAEVITGTPLEVKDSIARGDAKIAVGTTALLSSSVKFDDLALVVVDEEQRFGVQQRQILASKGDRVHRLHLTATPIPRSLALALRGDFDLSRIDERPPGRPQVKTRRVEAEQLNDALDFLEQETRAGNRVMFVVPRIEDGDGDDPIGVEQLAKRLQQTVLGQVGIATLHGGLSQDQRTSRMNRFRSGSTPVLVATSIVEVGLDVPELTVLWIEGADRFGLAQLHQLRGRVGRSDRPSWCFFSADPSSQEADQRLQAFLDEQDGFLLAERDLHLRGGGDVSGERQSGRSDFLLARPLQDLPAFQGLSQAAAERLEAGDEEPEGTHLARLGRYLGPHSD
ncbi:MAG: ATP-dependent DNA helicase RecG [Planctomycetota bacterium]|nr:ATP-dependent DNA helicase RecG [Planctomycetota bacterium]